MPKKGYKLSEEHKHKLSESHKGKPSGRKGKTCSKEHKLKISLAQKGKTYSLGYKHTPEAKLKMSITRKGKPNPHKGNPLSEEHKQNISLGNKGKIPWIKGKHHTKETKQKISIAKVGKYGGENHPNWLGGISSFPYPFDWTDILKESIRIRDNHTCQECGIHQDELNHKLDIHHIDYNKDNLNPSNLISLCRSCHVKTNFNRIQWYEYFITKIINPITV
jgi:hypothetical protein